MIAILVTTYNRPSALARSLPQIAALGPPILVVDDGTPGEAGGENAFICQKYGARYMALPSNRGLAAALNMGLAYWLADKSVEWISYFQDDVDAHPKTLEIIGLLAGSQAYPIYTGHDAIEHPQCREMVTGSLKIKVKKTCAGVHLHARTEFWKGVMPIPTYQLGAPKRTNGNRTPGIGSNVDWWIVRDGPNSVVKRRQEILCLPDLVRTFLWKAEDSSWNRGRKYGEERPLATWIN